ncbi:MAG: type II toxin-antitoxin system VapC family toxin [Planctomycetes bacterium]|nr:type II toxin-antitoxin system VapC family toxin [Planctomycetota bacterium]
MKPKVYVETSVVSYLTSKLSRDLLVAGHQQVTQEWWDLKRQDYDLFCSEVVVREAGEGDAQAAAKRLQAIQDVATLELTQAALDLASELIARGAVPAEKPEDAFHIAIAATNGVDYLLTWNCAHIANAKVRHLVEGICHQLGYVPPVICTPEELMED